MNNTWSARDCLSFFKGVLTDELLFFWRDRCLDKENGGYLNCFSNDGTRLISADKYTWSQGRFLWIFSRLAIMESELFTKEERAELLAYAKSGADFLKKHAWLEGKPLRCVFLTDEKGHPKAVEGHEGYDLSISADCFVAMGFAAYARATDDESAWAVCKELSESVYKRYESGEYRSLPYPVPRGYRAHAKPMILTNMLCETYHAARIFEPDYTEVLKKRIKACHREVFEVFRDGDGLIHEFAREDGCFAKHLLCQHINPGHTLEDMWFQWEAAELLGLDVYRGKIKETVLRTLELGWDKEYGGILHFVPCDGLHTAYGAEKMTDEPQMKLVLDDWGSKLWWVHSEALYTTLLMYLNTRDEAFLSWFEKVLDYTFRVFPNPNRAVREWIQIRARDGTPQDKVVALPVKDPYHIMRNVLLIIELLERQVKQHE